ncbi:MAG: class I SAM-dependent methyltransferase [Saprospiraceae bacterium]|nr:class I SAM-dependent methyltransferase [Saprospiraceae bacterium]
MMTISDPTTRFERAVTLEGNRIRFLNAPSNLAVNQGQTRDVFSDKWNATQGLDQEEKLFETQRAWFLRLYGFETEESLRNYLQNARTIVDTGCGLGYKAAWLAELAPHACVMGIDLSDSVHIAARRYAGVPNLFFLQADIADTGLRTGSCDVVVCDQVIMHTEDPERTFVHLADITSAEGEFLCYFYRRKALPRELVDDHFRSHTHGVDAEAMWEFSAQLTELGKRLSELNVSFECPDIPMLGIQGGTYDIQRFIYWNFLKCFWRPDWGFELSKITNFDWYAPSNARRFSREEVDEIAGRAHMVPMFFHGEEACYSGRFRHAMSGPKQSSANQ